MRYIDGDSTALESWIKVSLVLTIAWYVRLMVMEDSREMITLGFSVLIAEKASIKCALA